MSETLHERCMRICMENGERCFNESPKQLTCLADMLINKVYGLSSVLELLRAEAGLPETATELLEESNIITAELIDWVKYLQITRDLRGATLAASRMSGAEKRKEGRFPFPALLKEHISFRAGCTEEKAEAELINFSQHGVQFLCTRGTKEGEEIEAELEAVNIQKTMKFKAVVKYSKDGLVGAAIKDVSSLSEAAFFDSLMGFISETLVKIENSKP